MSAIGVYKEAERNEAKDKAKEKVSSLFPMPSLKDVEGIDEPSELELKKGWAINPMRKILAYEIKKVIHNRTASMMQADVANIPAIKSQIEGLNAALAVVQRTY